MNKLSKIQSELKAPKNQYNKFGGYYFRNCEDILEAVKPLLVKEDCTLTICDDVVLIGNEVYVKATVTFSDGNEIVRVSAFAREEKSRKGFDAPQLTGVSSSYARKYALNGLFLIDDTKDPDTPEYKNQGDNADKGNDKIEKDKVKYIDEVKQNVLLELYKGDKDKIYKMFKVDDLSKITESQFV